MKNKKLTLLSLTLLTSVFLTSCDGAPLTGEDFFAKLFPNPWEALFTFVAFVLLLIIVFFVAYKPVKKMIKERHDYVEGQISEANKANEEAKHRSELALEEIKNARKEGIEIVNQAKADALVSAQEIKEKAQLEIQNEKKLAKEDIEREIKASQEQIHDSIVDVTISASEKVLKREVTKKDNEALIDDFVKDLEEGK